MTSHDNNMSNVKLAIIGCGVMGKSILSAILDSKVLLASQIKGTVGATEELRPLQSLYSHVHFSLDNEATLSWASVILICLKPFLVEDFLRKSEIRRLLREKVVISIAAGVTLSSLRDWLSESHVIRAMPNTPCQIREGMVILSSAEELDTKYKEMVVKLLTPLGKCRFAADKYMDAVTALGGSGPAFNFLMLDAMADGGVLMGLPRDLALEIAAQTMQGAARMVLQTGEHPGKLKDNVTTPGGCTIAGLLTMEDGRVRSVIARTIEETTKVASKLGQKK